MNVVDISKRLKDRRKELEMSQKAYSLWEEGKRQPKFESIAKLEKVLKITLISTNVPRGTSDIHEETKPDNVLVMDTSAVLKLFDKANSERVQANEERIKALEKHNDFLQRLVETNLNQTYNLVQSMYETQIGHGEAIMHSLDRLEKKPAGSNASEADKIEMSLKEHGRKKKIRDKVGKA